jgi:hypothetical protein
MSPGSWQHGLVPEHQAEKIININGEDIHNWAFPLQLTGK